MKPSELKTTILSATKHKYNLLIKGSPGIGKTDIVTAAAEESDQRLIISHPVVSDPVDYKGLPFVIDGEAVFLPFGELKKLISADKPTIFFMDDLGQAPPSVQAAAMQLLLARAINEHPVSDHVSFVAATNRKQDKAGVSGVLEPVKSRFSSIVELEVDLEDWVKWARANNMPPELIAFLRFRPGLLNDFKPTADMTNSPCPRTIAHVGKWMSSGISKELEYEIYMGAAGEGFAAELITFLKIYRNLESPDYVIAHPDKAKVSDDPATLYAMCGALAAKADQTNMDAICTYANRMIPEFSVLLIKEATSANELVAETPAFITWASKHKDVLI